MGESREGEGRNAEGVTTTISAYVIQSYRNEGIDLDYLRIDFVTEDTWSVVYRERGESENSEQIHVSVDPGIF